jgi:hypothetical protein
MKYSEENSPPSLILDLKVGRFYEMLVFTYTVHGIQTQKFAV